jgi:signal transduction histidine kinase
VGVGPTEIPKDLSRAVTAGHAAHQRYRDSSGTVRLAVGVPIGSVDADYVELFSLQELAKTLGLLRRSLLLGVVGATLSAAIIGRAVASRVVEPLHPIANAAERIAAGALDTRIEAMGDPDLGRLAAAFNTMAAALEARIERETRFAADVSHELRSPLTAVAAAVEIMGRRRDQLPPEVTDAFVVLADKVERFQRMVLDLWEISRLDAGTAVLSDDVVDVAHLVQHIASSHPREPATAVVDDTVDGAFVRGDRRRLAQTVSTIFDNADLYAGGVERVRLEVAADGASLRITIDDHGPGVDAQERDAIFGRFARGVAGTALGTASGTGLGLALAAEHVRLHGGRLWVEDAPGGGARFVIEIPRGDL